MKPYFLLILFLLINQPICLAGSLVRFTIDKDVYAHMSDSQRSSVIRKTQELISFVETEIKTVLPADIQAAIESKKIKISLTDLPGRDGLFVPQTDGEHVISMQLNQLNSNGMRALIAHELFHAIHFEVNPDELPWVREGLAQVFEYITTGELNGMNLRAAIKDPLTPLLGDYDPDQSVPAQYGHNMLYFFYLYNQCGKNDLFWKMTKGSGETGLKGSFMIDAVLKQMKNTNLAQCENFPQSAVHFEVAKLHNQVQFLSIDSKHKFYVSSSDITPQFTKIESTAQLKQTIAQMPVLSSLKIPMNDFLKFKGDCRNCSFFYADTVFPYSVTEEKPVKTKGMDIILVKLRQAGSAD